MMAIDHTNPTPLYRQIVDDIKSQIDSGSLAPGDQVAPNVELAKRYDVSLITIKKAVSELIREGFLYGRVGKGTFVAESKNGNHQAARGTIGLVLTDFQNPFFMQIAHHIESDIARYGYNLLFSYSSNDFEREEHQIRHFQEIGVLGLIIASTEYTNHVPDIVRELHASRFPYVMISYVDDTAIHYVGTDHERGAYLATEFLIQNGCNHLGYLGAEKGNPLGALRRAGYLRVLSEHGIPANPDFEFTFPVPREDFESGFAIGETFCRQTERPDGVFAFNDQSAFGFERALAAGCLKIPEDVALVGFDDVAFPAPPPVPLTTVHQPTDRIAKLALEKLNAQIEGASFEIRTILEPSLVVRASCGARQKKEKT